MKRFIKLLNANPDEAINDFFNRYLSPEKEETVISFPAIFNKEKEVLEQIDIHLSRTTPYFYLVLPYGSGDESYLHLLKDKKGIQTFFAYDSGFYPSIITLSINWEYRIKKVAEILEKTYIFSILKTNKSIYEQEKEKLEKKEEEIKELKQQVKKVEEENLLFKKQQFSVDDFLSFYFKSCFPACGVIKDYKTLKQVIQKMFKQYSEEA